MYCKRIIKMLKFAKGRNLRLVTTCAKSRNWWVVYLDKTGELYCHRY